MAQIVCKNVTIGYDKNPILKDLSFEINKGDYVCIVGENGAGKSTLIKSILGLVPVIEGKIEFGDDLKKTQIGYLPQQTVVQKDFPATVFEVVMSGFQNQMKFRPFHTKKEKLEARENLKKGLLAKFSPFWGIQPQAFSLAVMAIVSIEDFSAFFSLKLSNTSCRY